MPRIVATFTWNTTGKEQSADRSVNAVSVTSELNRGAWVDLCIQNTVPGLPAGANVTLQPEGEGAFGPALVALGPFFTPAGGWIRAIPRYHHQASRSQVEGGLRVLCAARDVEDTCDFIEAMAAKLGIVLHTDDMSRVDVTKLSELRPCGACLPVPARQPAEAAFAELLNAIGHETQAVAGWTRIVGAEGYVLVGKPASVPDLPFDEWTWTVALPERCHDFAVFPIGAKRMERRLPEDSHRMLDVLFNAEKLFEYERDTKIPLAPGSVNINGSPHMVVAVRTAINVVDEQPEPAAKVELDLIDSAYGVAAPFVPRTCTLIGELSDPVWIEGDDRSVRITPPAADAGSDLPPRLVNWNAIECRAKETSSDDAGRGSLPGYVAAPFAPRRDEHRTAMYDPWSAGDLVIFQASTFQPLVVLGAYGRKMEEFEKEDPVWVSMRGKYRITGNVEITGTLDSE